MCENKMRLTIQGCVSTFCTLSRKKDERVCGINRRILKLRITSDSSSGAVYTSRKSTSPRFIPETIWRENEHCIWDRLHMLALTHSPNVANSFHKLYYLWNGPETYSINSFEEPSPSLFRERHGNLLKSVTSLGRKGLFDPIEAKTRNQLEVAVS